MSLMVSISGIRGIVGVSLTPEVVVKYASAFAEYCKGGKIVIGRDGRITGKIIGNIVASTLLAKGCDVIALGVAPTPTIGIAVEQLHAAGGISITASHDPMEWNGLKFIGNTGMLLNADENRRMWAIADQPGKVYASWKKIGKHLADDSFLRQHIDMVMNLPYVKVDVIRGRKFKVVVDCVNAAGGVIVPFLLRELGCDVIEMNCEVSGVFRHTPEPVPENLSALAQRVRDEHADFGVAVDPDVDRLVFMTEKGEPYGEEYTVTSAVKFVLAKQMNSQQKQSTVVVNLSTTRAVDDVAHSYGATVVRTPVGEINVATKMKETRALIGGEGSGGVILPAVHYGRDAIVGIGLIVQQLAEFGGTLSEFKATLPEYNIVKSKVELTHQKPDQLFEGIRSRYASNGNTNTDDGLKIDFTDSWIHLRKSNKEQIVRIISEAPTTEQAHALVQQFTKYILAA
ncbi:MAG: phosphoglucosamine mutase [Ignavibacteriae bacterium]|nr:phosphoglucosamine mutase [Ignavibacteria bacterium]MBI3364335.1 phosphoglucosamine mutase [Ignavibacteriota bacterium]